MNCPRKRDNSTIVDLTWFEESGDSERLNWALSHVDAALAVFRPADAEFYIDKAERLRADILRRMEG